MTSKELDTLSINTLRFLATDAVQDANSGHPGLPLGAAPMAYIIWNRFLKHNPENPHWFDRDRFILSAGHGSALLYALLHMAGYDLSLDDIKNFRQWGSKTPGHPEFGHTPGVETTTGPLGQGFANGVGMAMAEKFLADKFNRNGLNVINHFTYAIISDGDLMEGIASEAASMAGHLGLGKMIYLYDDNRITIDGSTDLTFSEDVGKRFDAYGWHVQHVEDGNDLDAIELAVKNGQEDSRPSIIIVWTHIGYGSPKQDTAAAHGEPLGEEALLATKEKLGWPPKPMFHVPHEAKDCCNAVESGKVAEKVWNDLTSRYGEMHPDLMKELKMTIAGDLPERWEDTIPSFTEEDGPLATRAASGAVLNAVASTIDNLVGGSADLAPSNKTIQTEKSIFGPENGSGHNIHFGVREHAMAGIANGMALHGGVIPYVATFLIFSDYMRPSIRLSALMQTKVTYIFTHDSVGVGEDGPTHQPVEQTMSLRLIPGLTVLRPADANETAEAWCTALSSKGPVVLVLTRQKLPILDKNYFPVNDGFSRGGYILSESNDGATDIILIATGSEVSLALQVQQSLSEDTTNARVISMPSWELFEQQPEEYRHSILPRSIPKVALEAGITMGWHSYIGDEGLVIGIDRFGASAPGPTVMDKLGMNKENVLNAVKNFLANQRI